jgi:hypothetical protein
MKTVKHTSYSLELAKEICDTIATSTHGLKKLCKMHEHWPHPDTIYMWLKKYPEFVAMYSQAKKDQVEALVDEILEISDDSSQDNKTNKHGETICDKEWVARSRLKVDTRKWIAAKLVPRLYGDNSGIRELYEEIAELKRELAKKELKNG